MRFAGRQVLRMVCAWNILNLRGWTILSLNDDFDVSAFHVLHAVHEGEGTLIQQFFRPEGWRRQFGDDFLMRLGALVPASETQTTPFCHSHEITVVSHRA